MQTLPSWVSPTFSWAWHFSAACSAIHAGPATYDIHHTKSVDQNDWSWGRRLLTLVFIWVSNDQEPRQKEHLQRIPSLTTKAVHLLAKNGRALIFAGPNTVIGLNKLLSISWWQLMYHMTSTAGQQCRFGQVSRPKQSLPAIWALKSAAMVQDFVCTDVNSNDTFHRWRT